MLLFGQRVDSYDLNPTHKSNLLLLRAEPKKCSFADNFRQNKEFLGVNSENRTKRMYDVY